MNCSRVQKALSVNTVCASLTVTLPVAEPEPTDSGSDCTLSKGWCVCVCVSRMDFERHT